MIEINIHNITAYLVQKTSLFDPGKPIDVLEINEDSDPDAEGYVNFIFRIRQEGRSYILKQARTYLKVKGIANHLSADRNYLEYYTYFLRSRLLEGNFVPKLYYLDQENHLFIMEDLSYLRIMRFQLCSGVQYPNFPAQIGEYLAKTHFYTSELCLSKESFCTLSNLFNAHDMRSVMENVVLYKFAQGQPKETAIYDIGKIGDSLWQDHALRLELMRIRDVFIKKGECLIHGDLHTSNIFINQEKLCVIDMEYSFMGPFGYDLGYLLANFIAQFSAFNFKEQDSNQDMQGYFLKNIKDVLDDYMKNFRTYFYQDGKEIYQNTTGYVDRLCQEILEDAIGFMGTCNFLRICNLAPYPDYDCIKDPLREFLAKSLSLSITSSLVLNRKKIYSTEELIAFISHIRNEFILALANEGGQYA